MIEQQGQSKVAGDQQDPPIRILHVVSTLAIKTDTKWLDQLLGRLSRDRFVPAVACLYGSGEMMQQFTKLGIPTFNLDAPHELSPTALHRTYRLIRAFGPHIVHTHLLRADLYGGLAARMAKVPVILSTAYALGAFRRDKIRRLDGLLDQLCRLLPTDALAVSSAVRDDLIARDRWPADRVNVIHTGITFPDQTSDKSASQKIRQEWQIPETAPLVITVARLSYEKGIDVLIQAAQSVHRDVPEARFVIVGDGPLQDDLREQIDAAGLTDVVRLAGFRKDIGAVLSAADLFVLPSLMEGMPNAILEAYAAQLPVIATSAGGLMEAVEHEHSGLLVRPSNSTALASAITRVLRDETLRNRLAQQGNTWARERFSIERVVNQYEDLYEELYRAHMKPSQRSAIAEHRG